MPKVRQGLPAQGLSRVAALNLYINNERENIMNDDWDVELAEILDEFLLDIDYYDDKAFGRQWAYDKVSLALIKLMNGEKHETKSGSS